MSEFATKQELFLRAAIQTVMRQRAFAGVTEEQIRTGTDEPPVVVARQAIVAALVENFKESGRRLAEDKLMCSLRFIKEACELSKDPQNPFAELFATVAEARPAAEYETRTTANLLKAAYELFRIDLRMRYAQKTLAQRAAQRAAVLIMRFGWGWTETQVIDALGIQQRSGFAKMMDVACRDYIVAPDPDFASKVDALRAQFETAIVIPEEQLERSRKTLKPAASP